MNYEEFLAKNKDLEDQLVNSITNYFQSKKDVLKSLPRLAFLGQNKVGIKTSSERTELFSKASISIGVLFESYYDPKSYYYKLDCSNLRIYRHHENRDATQSEMAMLSITGNERLNIERLEKRLYDDLETKLDSKSQTEFLKDQYAYTKNFLKKAVKYKQFYEISYEDFRVHLYDLENVYKITEKDFEELKNKIAIESAVKVLSR